MLWRNRRILQSWVALAWSLRQRRSRFKQKTKHVDAAMAGFSDVGSTPTVSTLKALSNGWIHGKGFLIVWAEPADLARPAGIPSSSENTRCGSNRQRILPPELPKQRVIDRRLPPHPLFKGGPRLRTPELIETGGAVGDVQSAISPLSDSQRRFADSLPGCFSVALIPRVL